MTSTINSNPMQDPERTIGGEGAGRAAVTYPGPFRCPNCTFVHAVGINFLEHTRSHALLVQFECALCHRLFPTVNSVSCHYSYCRKRYEVTRVVPSVPTDVGDPDARCPECGAQFKTVRGLQQHRRNAHPAEFQASRPHEKVPRWSEFEISALASFEASLVNPPYNINQVLADMLWTHHGVKRNVEMIKGQRRKAAYRSRVLAARERLNPVTGAVSPLPCSSNGVEHASLTPEVDELAGHDSLHDEGSDILRFLQDSVEARATADGLYGQLLDLAAQALRGENVLETTATVVLSAINVPPRHKVGRKRPPEHSSATNARQQKRLRYKELTKLYRNDKKRLAEVILDGARIGGPGAPLKECVQFYTTLFSSPSLIDDEPVTAKSAAGALPSNADLFRSAITEAEITTALSKIPARSSPGLDRVTIDMLRSLSISALRLLFNLWMHYSDVPAIFKKCRTVLIPKCFPPTGPKDYRPITIASMFYRIFTKIVAKRLSALTSLNMRQKGFIRGVNGCGENIFILNSVLTLARRDARELCLASLDVSKAFDSVSHSSIKRALARQCVPAAAIALVMNLLRDSTTVLEHSDGVSAPIPMLRGVKQGDPLSPLLFNVILDELLDDLESAGGGFTVDSRPQTNCLAFADDLLLLSDSKAGLQSNLLRAHRFFSARGLVLNVQKCHTLRLYKVPRCRTVSVSVGSDFYLDPGHPETVLPAFTGVQFLKYLGVDFNPFGRRRDQVQSASELLERVRRAQLKPQQKIDLIRSYVLPRLLYPLTVGNPLTNAAATIDKRVRFIVKEILHLPVSSLCDDWFYLPKSQGGLGFICLQETADFTVLRLLLQMRNSPDATSHAVALLGFNQQRASRLATRRHVLSLTAAGLHAAKCALANAHKERFMRTYQGSGFKEFGDRHSNSWLTGEGMKGHSFIAAIKVRTSLVPTRTQTLRGRAEPGDQRVLCRRCGSVSGAPETLSHVSQLCAFNHGLIVRRHDVIVKKLATLAEAAGFRCVVEGTLRHEQQTFKPDLILSKDLSCFILDVAIPWESNDSLARRHCEKCRKYAVLKEAACSLTETKDFSTGAIVIGARGAWCAENDKTLRTIGLSISDAMKSLLCLMVLERTSQIVSWFMRSTTAFTPPSAAPHPLPNQSALRVSDRAQPG